MAFTRDDVVKDTPTNTFANFIPSANITVSEGNLKASATRAYWDGIHTSISVNSGKWYWEGVIFTSGNNRVILGAANTTANYDSFFDGKGITGDPNSVLSTNPLWAKMSWSNYMNNTTGYTGDSTVVNNLDIIAMFLDLDSGTPEIKFYHNGTLMQSFNLVSNRYYTPIAILRNDAGSSNDCILNLGQDPTFANTKVPTKVYTDASGYGRFFYEPPAGAMALCTANLDTANLQPAEYIVDETNQHMLTYNGNAQISKFSPYATDGWSINFAENRLAIDYDSGGTTPSDIASFLCNGYGVGSLGTSDHTGTIEAWIYPMSVSNGDTSTNAWHFPSFLTIGSTYFSLGVTENGILRVYWYDPAYLNVDSTIKVQMNTWTHVAVVINGTGSGNLKLYINGIECTNGTQEFTGVNWGTGSDGLYTWVGGGTSGGSTGSTRYWYGYITDFKVMPNVVKYSSNFTPSTQALDNTDASFLLSINNKTIKDASSNNLSVLIDGSPSITDWSPYQRSNDFDTAFFRAKDNYYGGSFKFDGNSGYITTPYDSMLNGDVTIEGWYYFSSNKQYQGLWGSGVDFQGINLQYQELVNKKLSLFVGNGGWGISGGGYYSNTLLEVGNWYHIAYMKNNLTHYVFINGVLDSSINGVTATGAHTWSSNTFYIGVPQLVSRIMDGYISDFRITNSLLYPTNGDSFTPPALKLTSDVNTELLTQPWHTKTSAGVMSLIDSYPQDETGKALTYVGNAAVSSSSPYKSGDYGSFSLNENNYLRLTSTSDFSFSGDLTMEAWIKRNVTNIRSIIVNRSDRTGNNNNSAEYAWFVQNNYFMVGYPGASPIITSGDFDFLGSDWGQGDWVHIAWTRSGTGSGANKFFVNGKLTTSSTATYDNNLTGNGRNIEIGTNNIGGEFLNGNITEVRVVQGQALYTADFIPPLYPIISSHYTTDGTDPVTSSTKQSITGTLALLTQPGTFTKRNNVAAQDPDAYMKSVIWTGQTVGDAMTTWDGTTGIIECGFQPDLVWSKGRGPNTWNNFVHDSVRGGGNYLITNDTGGQNTTSPNIVESFNSSGFTIKGNGNSNNANDNYVAWCWKAGGAPSADGVAMVDGSATTTVALKDAAGASITPTRMSVNTKAGFSIVKYSGNGSIPHGLSSPLDLLIVKVINLDGENWGVWHSSFSSGDYIYLNSPNPKYNNSSKFSGVPSSTVFQVGADSTVGNSSYNYIAYCWHSVAGYSAFGSYTGNGDPNGPFVYTGFRPAWIMVKWISGGGLTSGSWRIMDTARNPYNPATLDLIANEAVTETTYGADDLDILSNGFKWRSTGSFHNYNNAIYIYAAFAEQPGKYSNAR